MQAVPINEAEAMLDVLYDRAALVDPFRGACGHRENTSTNHGTAISG